MAWILQIFQKNSPIRRRYAKNRHRPNQCLFRPLLCLYYAINLYRYRNPKLFTDTSHHYISLQACRKAHCRKLQEAETVRHRCRTRAENSSHRHFRQQ